MLRQLQPSALRSVRDAAAALLGEPFGETRLPIEHRLQYSAQPVASTLPITVAQQRLEDVRRLQDQLSQWQWPSVSGMSMRTYRASICSQYTLEVIAGHMTGHRASFGVQIDGDTFVYYKIGSASSKVPVSPEHADWIRSTFLMPSMSCSKLKLLQHDAGAREVVTSASKHPLLIVVLQRPYRGVVCLQRHPLPPSAINGIMHSIGDSRTILLVTMRVGTDYIHIPRAPHVGYGIQSVSTSLQDDIGCGQLPFLLCQVCCEDMGPPGFLLSKVHCVFQRCAFWLNYLRMMRWGSGTPIPPPHRFSPLPSHSLSPRAAQRCVGEFRHPGFGFTSQGMVGKAIDPMYSTDFSYWNGTLVGIVLEEPLGLFWHLRGRKSYTLLWLWIWMASGYLALREVDVICSLVILIGRCLRAVSKGFDATRGYPGEGPCSICGISGHDVRTCPEIWGPRKSSRPAKCKKGNPQDVPPLTTSSSSASGSRGMVSGDGQGRAGATPIPATPAAGLVPPTPILSLTYQERRFQDQWHLGLWTLRKWGNHGYHLPQGRDFIAH
eukprot:3783873-Amphidinium_carterae.1